jgi:hypothetical protein
MPLVTKHDDEPGNYDELCRSMGMEAMAGLPLSYRRAIMRQIKTIIERTPAGFDAQVNAAIQAIGSEHLREIRTMISTPTEPDRLHGAFIAILIYDLIETGQERL